VLVCLLVASPSSWSAVPAVDRRTGCRLLVPDGWAGSTVHWTGACAAGLADGLGIAVTYPANGMRRTFFGRMAAGHMTEGVIEEPDGFRAGRYAEGEPAPTDDRQAIIVAFRVAAEAARAAGDLFRQQGNRDSADYYRRKAEQLAAQMD
jgi:hypothetical protein